MSDLAPRFESVPVEVARSVAQREKMMTLARTSVCAICEEHVNLEQCKVDENGDPVHGECYVKKVQSGGEFFLSTSRRIS
jgi:hypothetical protein